MASAFTHAAVALALSTAAPSVLPRRRLALALVALATLPDLDVLGFYAGIPYAHPLGHRGFSHSLAFALLAGCAAGAGLTFGARASGGANGGRALTLMLLCSLACASHGLLDALTDAGLGVGFFLPLDEQRYFFDWRPLRTSPLSPAAFASPRGLAILANEAIYIWLPLLLAVWLGRALRQRRLRR